MKSQNCLYILLGSIFLFSDLEGTEFSTSLKQAEFLFSEGLFSDASPIYENLLHSSELKDESSIRMRLAACYIQENNPVDALKVLSDSIGGDEKEKSYLLATAFRRLGEHRKAFQILEKWNSNADPLIQLELGLNSYFLHDAIEATRHLSSISLDKTEPSYYWVAQIYLAKMQLDERNVKGAERHLDNVKQQLPQTHPLHFEVSYLEGLTSVLQQDLQSAYLSFEKSLHRKNPEQSPWYSDTIYQMAQCCQSASDHFVHAEDLLNKGWLISNEDRFSIALAELYFRKARILKDADAYEKGKQWAMRHPRNRYALLLAQASAAPSLDERTRLYTELTAPNQKDQSSYTEAWLAKGMYEYEMHSPQAIESFQQAYQLSKDKNPNEAAMALQGQALAYFSQGSQISFQQGWTLLHDFRTALKQPDELYYTGALLALNSPSEIPLEKALKFINEGVEAYPNEKYTEKMLLALGIFYYNKEDFEESDLTFSRLLKMNPKSPFRSEALYWKGRCAECRKDYDAMRSIFKEIYEADLTTPFAAKAYFRSYRYQDYMQGSKKALKHLQAMAELFPDHPLLVVTFYLMGLDYKKDRVDENGRMMKSKNLMAAIDSFEKAESLFDKLYSKQTIPADELLFYLQVRYRAQLERGQANLSVAQAAQGGKRNIYFAYAKEVFESIRHDFLKPTPLLSEHLIKLNPYPELLEETEYQLAQLYLLDNKSTKAEEILNQMLDHYREVGQTQSYYLSRVWNEKGKLAQTTGEIPMALASFRKAEESLSQLGAEEKLDLWIQQSNCLKELGHYGEAMGLLSKVVNDESISGLRIKAMVLRAELYQLQGKHELALKQLEAASKKGGIWGKQAKEKMDKDYGYSS